MYPALILSSQTTQLTTHLSFLLEISSAVRTLPVARITRSLWWVSSPVFQVVELGWTFPETPLKDFTPQNSAPRQQE